ncbi:MAG: SulP family inorganic anion transporter [Bacteroidales bacterium]|nr:SulP family inorganic anion transporter [Bacteroidales bacterium]
MKVKETIDFHPRFFETLRNFNRAQFSTDIVAGIIVGVIAIPLAISFGIASGVGPTEGLVTAIIAGLIISALGGTKVQIGGPTGAFIVIIYGVIQQYGLNGLLIATIMTGIMLIIMGVVKLGSVIKFMPYPIIVGFTGGIAITIFSTQMNDLFGMGITGVPANFIEKWTCYANHISDINWMSFAVGIVSILIITLTPKISKKIPGAFFAIVIMTIVCWVLRNYAGIDSIKTIGDLYELPEGLPSLSVPKMDDGGNLLDTITMLLPVAFTMAMLGAIESLLSAMVADGVIGDKHNSNTELIAQGVANLVVPFFGGIPATGAIARTMANINNGGRTPVAGIVHTIVLLLVLLFLGSLVGAIPMPCLAGVLIVVSYNMSGWRSIVAICKQSRMSTTIMFTTLLLTVLFDLTIAIEVGLLMAIVVFMKRIMESTNISVISDEMEIHHDGEGADEKLIIPAGTEVYEVDGPFFFGIANKFDEITREHNDKIIRIVRMRKVSFIDSTGLHNLEMFIRNTLADGRVVILSGVNPVVMKSLKKAGLVNLVGEDNVHDHIRKAIKRAGELSAEMNLQ